MKFFHALLFMLIAVLLHGQTSAHFGAPKFAPEDGKKLLVIGQDLGSVGGLDSHQNGYVDNITTHIPAGVTTYTSLSTLDGLTNLANWGAGDVRGQSYLEDPTFDNSFIVIGLYLVNQLDAVINGFINSKIRTLANWCKNQNRPVFLRIGYEFEGPWNGYVPGKFKDAWRHIVQVFDEEGVQNVAYVWQSAGLNNSNIINWYPGDEYVNWVAYSHFDGFNMGQAMRDFAEERDKPIMIAEATPRVDLKVGNGEAHWRNWYQPLFDRIYDNDRIKALAYINADWESQSMWVGQGWGDSRVEANEFVKNTWINEINKAPWCTASDSLFELLNLPLWQDSTVSVKNEIYTAQSDIVISARHGNIEIYSIDNERIDAVFVWDLFGKSLYSNQNKALNYRIPYTTFPQGGIVISVMKEGKLISKKELIFR